MLKKLDPWFTTAYLLASAVSMLIIFSISPDRLFAQTVWLLVGFLIFLYLSTQDSAVFSSFSSLAYPLALVLLMATFVFGQNVRGSLRWIPLFGFHLQTSELAKPLLILSFASFLAPLKPTSYRLLLRSFLLVSIPIFLILKQPDLGTSLVVIVIFAAELLIARTPNWLFVVGTVAVIALAWLSPHFLHSYQLERLTAFLDPASDPLGAGYNVIQSTIAIGSGGPLGKGLGHGTQSHLRFLPERHTDFVFASLVEELGLVGGLLVILAIGMILYRLASLMLRNLARQERLILAGVFAYLIFQTFVNIGMNLGIAPVTGVTLPLISYGGSSILAIAVSLGIAGSISHGSTESQELIEIK